MCTRSVLVRTDTLFLTQDPQTGTRTVTVRHTNRERKHKARPVVQPIAVQDVSSHSLLPGENGLTVSQEAEPAG